MNYLKFSSFSQRNYKRWILSVSAIIFDSQKQPNKIILIKRENNPFKGLLCIPGGKVEKDENYIHATIREVKEETNLDVVFNENHLFKITETKEYIIITSVGFLKEGGENFLRDDSFQSQWMSKEEIISIDKEMFVPNIKELTLDAFDYVKKYL